MFVVLLLFLLVFVCFVVFVLEVSVVVVVVVVAAAFVFPALAGVDVDEEEKTQRVVEAQVAPAAAVHKVEAGVLVEHEFQVLAGAVPRGVHPASTMHETYFFRWDHEAKRLQ